jgi:hypothetical protein
MLNAEFHPKSKIQHSKSKICPLVTRHQLLATRHSAYGAIFPLPSAFSLRINAPLDLLLTA